jgi:hypothetical protein
MVFSLLLLAGCDRVLGLDRGPACFGNNGSAGAGLFRICPDGEPVPDYEPRASISTGNDLDPGDCTEVVVQTDVRMTEVCVIFAPSIVIANPIQIKGTRPLVLAATDELTVLVDLDLASRSPAVVGPGASFSGCPAINGTNDNSNGAGSGGGAGGSFGGTGGDGGDATVPGARADEPAALGFVRGGCDGGRGGSGAGSGGGGLGGRGGGALYLIAGTTLRITGTINTSAAAGAGGGKSSSTSHTSGGGGGGGSGGLIGLDAPEVILEGTARLLSNGGGGAGGGGGGSITGAVTTPGLPGSEARATDGPPFRTTGGNGGALGGGAGGSGGDRDAPAGPGRDRDISGGGGGGGGGVGTIVVFAATLVDHGAVASPAIEKK